MSNNPRQTFFQSSNSSTSTLRPRLTPLISYLDEVEANAGEVKNDQETHDSPSGSGSSLYGVGRAKANAQKRRAGNHKQTHAPPRSQAAPNSLTGGLWDSWSSLQGIASTLLGSDPQGNNSQHSKVPAWQKVSPGHKAAASTAQWGRSVENTQHVGAGTLEERQALVQAKKREALLLANAHERPDLTGRYKRRDSDVGFSNLSSTGDQDQDALVYVHRIQSQDTLAGIMIKYNCQPEVFRKVNRLWPNDNIQTRTHVFLPVDACSIQGKKLENPGSYFDLLDADSEDRTPGDKDSYSDLHSLPMDAVSSPVSQPLSQTLSTEISGCGHEAWVQIPQFPYPTEILRIPQRTLGYFPPARRKSGATVSEHTISRTSTPKSSFDKLRHPPTHAASLNASPVRRPRLQPLRQRSSSTTTNSTSFADHLKGPGGVGTLRGLRTEASRPGPAEDPLNRKLAPFLPDLAPPEAFPRTSLRPASRATPRASTDSVRSNSSTGLGEMGGTIEGWVRKLAGPKGPRGAPSNRMGDLIELDTQSDMGDEDGEQTPTELVVGGTTATEEAMLNERFPVRGRIRNAYVGKDKGD